VLDGGRAQASCIQTVPGGGYRFVAAVAHSGTPAVIDAAPLPGAPLTRSSAALIGDHRLDNAAAPHLSTVVLPFLNPSGRADQQFVADQITDDLTTTLSRFTGMKVISRSTAFT